MVAFDLLSHAALVDALFCAALAALSAAVVWAMIHVGVIDTPGARSSHTAPTPKGGGVGVVAAVLAGTALVHFYGAPGAMTAPLGAALAAAVGIAAIAYLDDILAWPAWVKLAAQAAGAAIAVAAGVWVEEIRISGLGGVHLGWLGWVGCFCWIVAATNAMNFIDGLNGLAAGVSLITSLSLAFAAGWAGDWVVYFAALALAAGLLGFLPFNFPFARIFMGDVGSQFTGFLLAVFTLAIGQSPVAGLSVVIGPLLLFGILFDVAFTLVRRAMAGDHLMQAHRGHLYQVAQRSGVPATRVALIHWAFAAWGAFCAIGLAAGSVVCLALVIPPQLTWLWWVCRRAQRHPVGRW